MAVNVTGIYVFAGPFFPFVLSVRALSMAANVGKPIDELIFSSISVQKLQSFAALQITSISVFQKSVDYHFRSIDCVTGYIHLRLTYFRRTINIGFILKIFEFSMCH